MNSINLKIKRLREQKGYSQEFMAAKLNISQASYARVESRKTNLSVDRLQKIAAILETDIPSLQSDPQLIVHSQTNNEGVYGNNYIENLHIENNEAMKKIIQILEAEINHLEAEIEFLRTMINAMIKK